MYVCMCMCGGGPGGMLVQICRPSLLGKGDSRQQPFCLFAKAVHKTLHSCYIYLDLNLNIPSIGIIAIELVGRSVL